MYIIIILYVTSAFKMSYLYMYFFNLSSFVIITGIFYFVQIFTHKSLVHIYENYFTEYYLTKSGHKMYFL